MKMKKNKYLRSAVAILCSVCMLLGNVGLIEATAQDEEIVLPQSPVLPANYTYVTPLDYGFVYDTYSEKNMIWEEIHSTKTSFTSMDEVLFETRITLGESTKFIYARLAESEWNGLSFGLDSDGTLVFHNLLTETDIYIGDTAYPPYGDTAYKFDPKIAIGMETTSFCDLQFQLAITTKFVAYNGNELNDLELGVWFNGQLYKNQYIYIMDCKEVCKPGILLHRAGEGNIILESPATSARKETNERYNLSDGPYLISGTGTILVNGVEYQNGDTLTTPGTYRIVSDNGIFVRNVELYDTGKKSTAFTHEENVMPIAGFCGPHSGTDGNGNTYNYISETFYELLEDAGFNLINYIPQSWSNLSHRHEMIQNLLYAEAHNIGLYLSDGRLGTGGLDATSIAELIASYSQYDSFKGIFVTDEPGGITYKPDRDILIDDCAELTKTLNGYCNLNGYINLLPYEQLDRSEFDIYTQYVDEYLTKTAPKVLSHDYYVFTYKRPKTYFYNLSIAREKSIQSGVPFWTYIQAGNWRWGDGSDIPKGTPTEEQMKWNVNTSLAYGAKGIQYYPLIEPNDITYEYDRYGIFDVNGNKTAWYDYAKNINRQIAAVDEVLLNSESKAVLAIGTNAQTNTGLSATSYGSLESVSVSDEREGAIIGAFDYQGKEAFYVVNNDVTEEETITLKFKGDNLYQYRMIQNAVGKEVVGNTCTLTVSAGEAVLVVLGDEYVTSVDGMQCVTPVDFGFTYSEYQGKAVSVGETVGTCNKVNSMDKVLMKTNITFEADTELRYMKASEGVDAHWTGLTFSLDSDGILHFRNDLTSEDVYVNDVPYIAAGLANYKFYPSVAFDENVTSFIGKPFNLTITSEFVDYEHNGSADDLKLGVYFDDKLYDNAYIYIKNCKDACYANMFLYRPSSGSITLASPMIFGMEMQPEITDSIAMNFEATLDYTLLETETPYVTFEMNGQLSEPVVGKARQAGSNVYIFTYPEIMAQNLADTVTATLRMGSSTKTYQCSMMDYCTRVLKADYLTDSNGQEYSTEQLMTVKELIVDLVQYATEVQKYRGNQTETTWFTTLLETAVPNYTAMYDQNDAELQALKDLKAVDQKLVGNNTGEYRWKNVGLVLGNKIKLRARFTASDVSGLTVTAKVNGVEQNLTFKETSEDGMYVIDFTDIYAYEYDEEVIICFYKDGTATGAELHYSVNTYLKEMHTMAQVQNLLLTIHNYGTAAKTYMSLK